MEKQPGTYHYIDHRVEDYPLRIEVKEVKPFAKFADFYGYKDIYRLKADERVVYFGVVHEGFMTAVEASGFMTIEDYRSGIQHHFPDSTTYYKAKSGGYTQFEDYKIAADFEVPDIATYIKVKEQGYISGFEEFIQSRNDSALPAIAGADNPYLLYKCAAANGFTSFRHFMDASLHGFADAKAEQLAAAKGYKTKSDYDSGMAAQFNKGVDLEKAREKKLRDSDDLLRYLVLGALDPTGLAMDQRAMLCLLSKLPASKKIPFSKLEPLFQKEKEYYRYEDTGEMPPWFTTAFTDRSSMTHFLANAKQVGYYGHFDSDADCFVTNALTDRKVLVDAASVAFNAIDYNKAAPKVEHLIRMVKELKACGFKDIRLLADANLKNRFVDADLLPELKTLIVYEELLPTMNFELMLPAIVKTNHCLLVSNFSFPNVRLTDPFIEQNLDYYRIPFKIEKDKVMLAME